MSGIYLLDTNVVIARLNDDIEAIQFIETREVVLSAVVLGELYFGARKSVRVEANLTQIERLASITTVVPCDESTGKVYGQIKDALRRKGRPIPENDIWIAATALQHDLTLLTRDAHFQNVESLRVQSW